MAVTPPPGHGQRAASAGKKATMMPGSGSVVLPAGMLNPSVPIRNIKMKFAVLVGLIQVGEVSNRDIVETVLNLVSALLAVSSATGHCCSRPHDARKRCLHVSACSSDAQPVGMTLARVDLNMDRN
uniref:Uncharacterized protein n=1 Tax=Fundulus heteroclitus TaxID=8078 RepID=A0A3Q2UA08_FUNHE